MALATLDVVALDCPDPRALAAFYAGVLGGTVSEEDDGEWVELALPDGRKLAFQRATGFVPPRWPAAEGGQQMHLDLNVPAAQLDAAEKGVLELGARLLETGPPERGWRVYADPAGHPFCLCTC
ncbi:VOC family protein [Streptomyces sp. J2-1]|uniref:VOC family protein n=1 Tax=Streptomyces corallincola TaxID=2851888 RepID=UPI001C3852BA|nr:VOC family protein [Streptomyces corallincola]MBV2356112.1 VOC family protein [Streptomyces corallincola]